MKFAMLSIGLVLLAGSDSRRSLSRSALVLRGVAGLPCKGILGTEAMAMARQPSTVSVSVCPPGHCDGKPGYVLVGPYCPARSRIFPSPLSKAVTALADDDAITLTVDGQPRRYLLHVPRTRR